jgi:hypothetical protein
VTGQACFGIRRWRRRSLPDGPQPGRAKQARRAPLRPQRLHAKKLRCALDGYISKARKVGGEALDEPEAQLCRRPQSGPCLDYLQRHPALQPRPAACLGIGAVPERRQLRLAEPKNRPSAGSSFSAYLLICSSTGDCFVPIMGFHQCRRSSVRRTVGYQENQVMRSCFQMGPPGLDLRTRGLTA